MYLIYIKRKCECILKTKSFNPNFAFKFCFLNIAILHQCCALSIVKFAMSNAWNLSLLSTTYSHNLWKCIKFGSICHTQHLATYLFNPSIRPGLRNMISGLVYYSLSIQYMKFSYYLCPSIHWLAIHITFTPMATWNISFTSSDIQKPVHYMILQSICNPQGKFVSCEDSKNMK